MQILAAGYGKENFSAFKDKAFYNSINILSKEGFDKLDSKMNHKFGVLLVKISNGDASLSLRIRNPNIAWKFCTGKMIKRRLKKISKILSID